MMSMLKLMSPAHFAAYIHQLEPGTEAGRQNLLDFVMEVLLMFKDLIQHRWAGIHRKRLPRETYPNPLPASFIFEQHRLRVLSL
jgi:hypothetical protein